MTQEGNSYPDITLLAPLARILKTDVDTLVSFNQELTDNEINQFINEIFQEISAQKYESAFKQAVQLIRTYPECDKLVLFLAQIADMYLEILEENDKEKYQKQITAWYEKVAAGNNKEWSHMAMVSLSQKYIAQKKYEEAQRLLDQIPVLGFDKRIAQANLYSNQEKYEEAFEIHEGMLYQSVNSAIISLMQMIHLYCKQKDYAQTDIYIKLAQELAEDFQITAYTVGFLELMPKVHQQKKEESLKILKKIARTMEEPNLFTAKTTIYKHLKFKEGLEFGTVKKMLKSSLENDPELDFLRKEPEFQRLLQKLPEKE